MNSKAELPPLSDACYRITGCAISILNAIGPGLEADIYERALKIELAKNKLNFLQDEAIDFVYCDEKIGSTILPIVVNDLVIVKCVSSATFNDTDYSENIAYLKNSKYQLALLLNFRFGKLQWKKIVIEAS